MKLGNKAENYCAKQGLIALENNDIPAASKWLQWILQISGAELSTYGSVPDEISEDMLPVVVWKIQNDQTFKIGQMLLGAAGGFLGLSPGDLALGGGGAGLLTMLITFGLGWLKKRKQIKDTEQKLDESERMQYAQAQAIELGSMQNPAVGTLMKNEIKREALAGTRQDAIVQQAVADLHAQEREINSEQS